MRFRLHILKKKKPQDEFIRLHWQKDPSLSCETRQERLPLLAATLNYTVRLTRRDGASRLHNPEEVISSIFTEHLMR